MRNLDLIDAVVKLHDIARLVKEETDNDNLHDDIRNCADRLHLLSLQDGRNSTITSDIITKAKE